MIKVYGLKMRYKHDAQDHSVEFVIIFLMSFMIRAHYYHRKFLKRIRNCTNIGRYCMTKVVSL